MQHNLDPIRALEEELFKQSVRGSPEQLATSWRTVLSSSDVQAVCMKRRRFSEGWLQKVSTH